MSFIYLDLKQIGFRFWPSYLACTRFNYNQVYLPVGQSILVCCLSPGANTVSSNLLSFKSLNCPHGYYTLTQARFLQELPNLLWSGKSSLIARDGTKEVRLL